MDDFNVRRRRRKFIEHASVSGNCCWKLCDEEKHCDILKIGDDRKPQLFAKLSYIQGAECNFFENSK